MKRYSICGLEELILLNHPYYPKQSTDLMQNTLDIFHRTRTDNPKIWPIWNTAAAKSLQSCPTLCDPIDSSPLGSAIPGILQVRTLEWIAISFSNAWKWKVKVKSLSHVRLLATPWAAAYQAPLSVGFSRQEYWSGVSLPSPVGFLIFLKHTAWSISSAWNALTLQTHMAHTYPCFKFLPHRLPPQ